MARKSVEELKASGSYRQSRHGARINPFVPAAEDIAPPADLPAELRPRWAEIVADFQSIGLVTRTDVVLLRLAFNQLENAGILQARFTALAADPATQPVELNRLQASAANATASFLKLVTALRDRVRSNPKRKAEDDWLGRTTGFTDDDLPPPKKSIKAVIARKSSRP
jgi:hypothetical protein